MKAFITTVWILLTFELSDCQEEPPKAKDNCGEFCLACLPTGDCLLCDLTKHYYWQDKACVKKEVKDCQVQSHNGTCLRCGPNMVSTPNGCVKIAVQAGVPENCVLFGNDINTCFGCATGFFLNGTVCSKASNQIARCLKYSTDGIFCLSCEKDFTPDESFTSCEEDSGQGRLKIENCQKHGFLNCIACNSAHHLEQNMVFLNLLKGVVPLSDEDVELVKLLIGGESISISPRQCSDFKLANCKVPERFNRCAECAIGFIKTLDSQCVPFPVESIAFCSLYADIKTCLDCDQKYYLKSKTTCAPVTPIPNCVLYHTKVASVCLECDTFYFLFKGLCVQRTSSSRIDNCVEVFKDRDMCKRCETGYVLNVDFTKCVKNVFNCNESDFVGSSLVCVSCSEGYYLKEGACLFGPVTKCLKYLSPSLCGSCEPGFYLSADKKSCLEHDLKGLIPCNGFSPSHHNYCIECAANRVGFTLINICLPATVVIPNCVKYASLTACEVCNARVSFLQGGSCLAGTVDGCSEYHPSRNQCISCSPNKSTNQVLFPSAPVENNSCVAGSQNEYFNCNQVSEDHDKRCVSCLKNFYPFRVTSPSVRFCVSTQSSSFPAGANTADCNVYDPVSNECLQCTQKTDGSFYFISNGACVSACPTGQSAQAFEVQSLRVSRMFVCKPTNNFLPTTYLSPNNIPCLAYTLDNSGKWSCLACSTTSVGVVDFSVASNAFIQYAYMLTSYFLNYFSVHNKITVFSSCVSRTSSSANSGSGSKLASLEGSDRPGGPDISSCQSLTLFATPDAYGCVMCKIGFSAVSLKVQGVEAFALDTCSPVPQCQSDVWVNGLAWNPVASVPLPLTFYLSCHRCSKLINTFPIPTFGIVVSGVVSVSPPLQKHSVGPFGIPSPIEVDKKPYQVVSLSHTPQTTCSQPGLTQSAGFVANCAVQAVLVDLPMRPLVNSMTTSETNPICVACLPMYTPVYSVGVPLAVDSCTPIPNCLSSNTFNKCDVCRTGFAMSSTDHFASCIQTRVDNCFMASSDSVCVLCHAGYVLNVDGACDFVKPLACSQSQLGFYQPAVNSDTMFKFFMSGAGCQQCDKGHVAVYPTSTQQVCVFSETIRKADPATALTSHLFIANCDHYGLDNLDSIVCMNCSLTYILREDQRACISQTTEVLKNCQMVRMTGLACLVCVEGFYFKSEVGKCVKGAIDNCSAYKSESECLKCDKGYLASKSQSGKVQCFQADLLNCIDVDQTKSVSGSLSCNQCAESFFLTSDPQYGLFPLRQCLSIPVIPMCLVYSTQAHVADSRLTCLSCQAGSYLSQGRCLLRTLTVDSCSDYSVRANVCNSCVQGYFLDASNQVCQKNPVGIGKCTEYKDIKTCLSCMSGYYLWQNQCLEVKSEHQVDNCQFYKSYFECSKCANNFFLDNNECKVSIASNCLRQRSLTKCDTCPVGMGLSVNQDITSCQPLSSPNCDIIDEKSVGPKFLCLQCSPGYYSANGLCAEVELVSKIANCFTYDKNKKCLTCQNSQILSQNRCISSSSTKSIQDRNCQSHSISRSCIVCKLGYYVKDNSCQSCATSDRCLQCNPYAPEECLICKSGYYQVFNKTCVQTGQVAKLQNSNQTNETNETVIAGNHPRLMFWRWVLLALLWG